MDSPLARALMRRRRDEEFTVEVPGGRRTYVVTEVRYESGEDTGVPAT
jgi:transcription elongation factor GreB